MFSSRIRLKSLAMLSRSLSTMLDSGISVRKAFNLAADKTGDPRVHSVLREVSAEIGRGSDIATSLRNQENAFPDLFIDMVAVAEQTGTLPEILTHLADHYDNTLRMKRMFLGLIALPMIQLVVAILVIAAVILVLGMIASSQGGEMVDLLGLGTGPTAAFVWLLCTFGTLFGLFVAYKMIVHSVSGRKSLDPILMQIPVLGNCMRSFAIARFSWAFFLTQQSGMSMDKSLTASLRATTNGAFIAATSNICRIVNQGDDLSTALAASQLFPKDFIHMVRVGENSGTAPEALHRLSPQFEDQARRSMAVLAAALGWGVWVAVAAFIIFLIFRVVLSYVNMLDDAIQQTF
ncbi:MAG: type II secretion system F family protein [Planctomycetes bacterium]|nr:type II secretion system F family protein [Planctomycetota bacterium]